MRIAIPAARRLHAFLVGGGSAINGALGHEKIRVHVEGSFREPSCFSRCIGDLQIRILHFCVFPRARESASGCRRIISVGRLEDGSAA